MAYDGCNATDINDENLESYCETIKMAREQFPFMAFYKSREKLEEDMAKGILRATISFGHPIGRFERCQPFITERNKEPLNFLPLVVIKALESLITSQ